MITIKAAKKKVKENERKGFKVSALKSGMVKINAVKDVRVYTSEDSKGWISDAAMMIRIDRISGMTGANRVLRDVLDGGDGVPFKISYILRDVERSKAPITRSEDIEQCAVFVTQSGVRIGIAKGYASLLSLGEAKADYMDPARKMITVWSNGEPVAMVMPMILP